LIKTYITKIKLYSHQADLAQNTRSSFLGEGKKIPPMLFLAHKAMYVHEMQWAFFLRMIAILASGKNFNHSQEQGPLCLMNVNS